MSLSIGIVGLPNVGKSTLFQALTKKQVDCSNYPFCTVEPNHGIVAVPDERLEDLHNVTKSENVFPATIEFVDIAGLVRGAHKGEGLGNQFLSHIREINAIAHVVRVFEDPNISHIHGTIDPKNDIEIINYELAAADLETISKRLETLKKRAKAGASGEQTKQTGVLNRVREVLQTGKSAKDIDLSEEELVRCEDLCLLTLKPVVYVLNIDEDNYPDWVRQGCLSSILPSMEERQPYCVLVSAKLEAELADLPKAEQKEYIRELGMNESGVDSLIKSSYKLLDLITFFTFNKKETRAWTIKKGIKASEAAGKVHTDFARGFIRAEVINWKSLIEAGSMENARGKGLVRTEGKEYVIQDGDICLFRFNV